MPKTPSKSTKSKPLSKRAQWDGFEHQVRALALELGIPETLYDLSKVRKKPGAGSEAWKGHERQFTELLVNAGFAAHRVSRGDDLGVSDVDIIVDDIPTMKVDCKYRAGGWAHHAEVDEAEAKYCTGEGDFLVLPTKGGLEAGSLVSLRSQVFVQIGRAHV